MIDPITVNVASFHMLEGLATDSAMRAASFTSGKEIKEESKIAISIRPGAPYGSRVATSQCERRVKNDISKRSSLAQPFRHKIGPLAETKELDDAMRVSILLIAFAVLLTGAPQEEKKKEPFDPLADPREELVRRTDKIAKEKKFDELKKASVELAELSQKMSDEIAAGGKDVISAKIWQNLDRAEKLVKTMREKAK
jgi:hypothetical protein